MELNDNSSKKSSIILSSLATEDKIKESKDTLIEKQSVICTFCSKKTEANFANLFEKPEILKTLGQLDVEIPPINDYSDYICYQCVFKVHCIQDYKRIWTSNIKKHRINYYFRKGDKEMVRRLIALKPSTSTAATPHLRTRSNDSSMNGDKKKESGSVSQSFDNNSNSGKDDCVQKTSNQTQQNDETNTEKINLSEIKISRVNLLHGEIISKKQSNSKHHKRSVSLSDKTSIYNSKLISNMPRRSSIVTNETTDLNHANDSNFQENGFFEESIHITGDSVLYTTKQKQSKTTQSIEISTTPKNQVNTMLNIMYEENEPAAVTESGGKISSSTPYKDTTTLKCSYCDRVYKKMAFFIKHEKKHERDNQKSISVNSNVNPKIVTVFECPDCSKTFPSRLKLNQHKKLHTKGFGCQYCLKEFELKWDAEFHEAICLGEILAKESNNENNFNGRTRSSRLTRSVKSKLIEKETENLYHKNQYNETSEQDEYELSDTTDIDSLFSSRMRNTNKWTEHVVQMQHENEGGGLDFDDNGDFGMNSYNINNRDVINKLKKSKSTRKSKKMKQNKSVKNYERLSSTYEYYDMSSESYNDDTVFVFINCENEDCEYQNVKLENVMKHDNDTHGTRPLYYCKKCKGSFLRRHYFQLHCSNQDPGCFLCFKCRAEFMYEELLHAHLEQHRFKELCDDEDYSCELCKMQFLDEISLMKHLATKDHLQLKERGKVSFKIRNSYPILSKQEENINSSNNNEMIYDATLLDEGQLFNNNFNFDNSDSTNEINLNNRTTQYVCQTRILNLKKYERKNYKYECSCIKKNCFNCQKHRKMIPVYGREPKRTKHYPHRSCNEVRLPFLRTWFISYI